MRDSAGACSALLTACAHAVLQVLGLLVRHATFIAEELAQTGVVEILTDALKDKMEKVRYGCLRGALLAAALLDACAAACARRRACDMRACSEPLA